MLRLSMLSSLPLLLTAALVVAGCQKPAEKSAPKASAPGEQGPAAAKTESPHPSSLPKGEGTSALTAEDRALIAKQKVCPVSGEPLGSMGDPIKIVVKGQTVFLCCSGCEEAIKKDPDKYLAKLKSAGQK